MRTGLQADYDLRLARYELQRQIGQTMELATPANRALSNRAGASSI